MGINYTELNTRLFDIDWNFPKSSTENTIHRIHPYPAKFIPEIPRTLIKYLNIQKETAILDPFCGSGTTLVEANQAGYPAIGVDLNPIACMIAETKLKKIPNDFINTAENCVLQAKKRGPEKIRIPDIPNLSHWFKKEIQEQIAALITEINNVSDKTTNLFLKTALSSILVRVSNQDGDTRYAAVEKKIKPESVYNSFFSACKKIVQVKFVQKINDPAYKIINKNILMVDANEIGSEIGAVITSPPYPNAYEYWLYHKYRMWWLGFDPLPVREQEIGARPHYHKVNSQDEQDFENQLDRIFSLFDKVLIQNGYVCFVIGRSIIGGRIIDNASIIEKVGLNHDLTKIARIPRILSPNRKSFNLSHAKIKKEEIVIMSRDR